ncbi:hypothetical protein F5Y17DRAFT_59136 [Xylariaceae sp. FL0594]|nr:hypothetical protein F5Y17DRAFT_59136 [Xylariaceae sp. FL0594]
MTIWEFLFGLVLLHLTLAAWVFRTMSLLSGMRMRLEPRGLTCSSRGHFPYELGEHYQPLDYEVEIKIRGPAQATHLRGASLLVRGTKP